MNKDGPSVPHEAGETALFYQLKNPYFAARFIEITSVLETLLTCGALNRKNFQGNAIDLATGSGIALLALRKYVSGDLCGVDKGFSYVDSAILYCGSYVIPTRPLVKAANATFHRQENADYLEKHPPFPVSLLTSFYIDSTGQKTGDRIIQAAGDVLMPGGQFLLTTDWNQSLPRVEWGEGVTVFSGSQGANGKTLFLPVPNWLRKNYGDAIEFAEPYLEDKIFEHNHRTVGCMRDRTIVVYTKNAQ